MSLLPVIGWIRTYDSQSFRSDAAASLVVLFITVPQVIAYAFLAGMPPETGLYAAIMALGCYALFGSSRALAVGPTAIVAMMTLEAARVYGEPGTAEFQTAVMQLTLVTGALMIVLRVVNFGSVISFLSHAVVTGFISAAAILIITNQIPLLLGISGSPDTSMKGVLAYLAGQGSSINSLVLGISSLAVAVLSYAKLWMKSHLQKLGISATVSDSLTKIAPMYVVVMGVLIVGWLTPDLASGVAVVGEIPNALPALGFAFMGLNTLQELIPSALLIAMVVFMESTSIGTAMASKSREKIDANQELIGLGAANLGSSLVGGFPVAGSFARSIVNFSAGAVTPLASLMTAVLVVLTLLLFAAAFHDLPKGVLSAIIVVSAVQLIDLSAIGKIFRFNAADAVTFSFTFLSVLILGVESGVLIGVVISFVLLIRSSSKPHIAVVGRVGDSEHFRNVERYDVTTLPNVLALRVDESMYFVNTRYIERFLFNEIADKKDIDHVLLICTSTNFIDTSGLEMLETLSENLIAIGVTLHLAEVKGPVMDKLKETGFYKNMSGRVYFTTDLAMKDLAMKDLAMK
ncbi:MAG: SulP family sulfate permease [Candidatus Azotimanducaceae bacterium]